MKTTPRLYAVHWVENGRQQCDVAPIGSEGEAWIWLWERKPYVDPASIRVELYRPSVRRSLS